MLLENKGMMKHRPPNLESIDTLCDHHTCRAIRKALRTWYGKHQRRLPWRETQDPYRIWISEVMLQQTQVKTVIPYFNRFMAAFPDIESLAKANSQAVLKLWEGLGYYRRAHHLMDAARKIVREQDGQLPTRREVFRSLPGIGDYIANAVMSIAFDQSWAVVDGNVKRVLARLFRLNDPVNRSSAHPRFQAIADHLLNRSDPSAHNQAVMELGALICAPRNPTCNTCPLADYCRAYREAVVDRYPMREKKAAIPEHAMVAGVVHKRGKILLVRRPDEACRRTVQDMAGLKVAVGEPITRVRHAYTHFKITLEVLACQWESGKVRLNGPAAFRWVRLSDLQNFPLPGAVKKVLPHLVPSP